MRVLDASLDLTTLKIGSNYVEPASVLCVVVLSGFLVSHAANNEMYPQP